MSDNKALQELLKVLSEPDQAGCYAWVLMYGKDLVEYVRELELSDKIYNTNHNC